MAFKRTFRKRTTTKRKFTRKRRTMNISRPRSSLNAVPQISVKRTCYLGTISPNTVATYGFWQYRTVSLNSGFTDQALANMGGLSNLSEYTALFDQFKLCAFKIVLRPRRLDVQSTQDVPTGSSFLDRNYVTIVKDPTDITSPTGLYTVATFNSFLECGKARTYRGDRPISIYMKPKVQEQYGSGANRYVSPKWTDLNTSGTTMPHRGFHLYFHNQAMTNTFMQYDVFITYYLKFKGMK